MSWPTVHIASTLQPVAVDQVIAPGIRVTVSMGAERNLDSGFYQNYTTFIAVYLASSQQ